MKILLPLLFSFLVIFNAGGASPAAGGDSDFQETPEATHIPAMIKVFDRDVDEAIAELEEQGVIILRHRGDILLAFIPVDQADGAETKALQRVKGISGDSKIEFSKPRFNKPAMDNARLFNNSHYIAEGAGLPSPYDGSGVVIGICDIGIDTRHPNFLTADGKECRIRKAVQYEELYGRRTVYSTPEEIYEWQTDNPDQWHGTHVAGIAAGSDASIKRPTLSEETVNVSFRSLAPNADIVFTASQLSDVGLLAGVEDIIDYAKEQNKPVVINLSMGNYVGPHDGTSLFSQYIDMCADDAIICLSSGNEGGDTPKSMSFDFTETDKEVRVLPNDWGGTDYYAETEVWSKDATPFSFMFYWNNNTSYNRRLDVYDPIISTDGEPVEWSISLDPQAEDYDPVFAEHFKEGYVKATAGISPINGRYYVNLQFELKTDELHGNTAWAEYWAGIQIKADPGVHVDIYTMGGNTFLRGERNFKAPDNEMNVSDLATGHRVISVGMLNNTDQMDSDGWRLGEANFYSGYGKLLDGRRLPITNAPGALVCSSMSSPYMEAHPEDLLAADFISYHDGQPVYWIYTLGTSMACPYVVGGIATWLQAYPRLTAEEAIEIIQQTNQTTGLPDPENPRHGQGRFNAYAGHQKIMELTSTRTGVIEGTGLEVKVENGSLLIGNPNGGAVSVFVYGIDGVLKETKTFNGCLGSISLQSLPRGVHVIRLATPEGASKTVKMNL